MCDAGAIEQYPDAGLDGVVEEVLKLTARQDASDA
jgi:hypothetical protein